MAITRSHRQTAVVVSLSPEAIRRTTFDRTPIGRRGYPEAEVDRFLDRVADELASLNSEKADLRAEIARLRHYFQHQKLDISPETGPEPSIQAVNTLSLAQQAADQHLAQAEKQARQLLVTARGQYEAIVAQAHQQAQLAEQAQKAQAQGTHPNDDQKADLEARVTYLRTFAEVTQVQVRSILEALGHELDRLAQLDVPRPAELSG